MSQPLITRKEFDQRLRQAHPSDRKRIIKSFLMGITGYSTLKKPVQFLEELYGLCMAEGSCFEDIGNYTFYLMADGYYVGENRIEPTYMARKLWTEFPHVFYALKKSASSFMRTVHPTLKTLTANPQVIIDALWQFDRDASIKLVDGVKKAVYLKAAVDYFNTIDARIAEFVPPSVQPENLNRWKRVPPEFFTGKFAEYERTIFPAFLQRKKVWQQTRLTSTLVIGGLFHQVYKTAAPAHYEVVDEKRRHVSSLNEKNKSFFDAPMVAVYLPIFETLAAFMGYRLDIYRDDDFVYTEAMYAVPRPENNRPAGYWKTNFVLP